MKIILLVGTFILLFHEFVDAVPEPWKHAKAPFLLNIDVNSPELFELPSTVIPLVTDLHIANDPKTAVAACPAPNTAIKPILKLNKNKKLPYCIFQKTFQKDQTKICEEEVKPLLRSQYTEINHQPRSCGTDPKNHHIYEYGFYYCGTTEVLNQLLDKNNKKKADEFIKPRFYPIYEMCADSPHRRALWTKHFIRTPGIFQNKNPNEEAKLQSELGEDNEEIGMGDLPSRMKAKDFQSRANRFKKQSKSKPDLVASPTFIVPMEHVALRMWRKALNHHINVAPFKENKSKLMIGVNNGIKKIALNLHSSKRRLTIYTAVRKFDHKKGKRGDNWDKHIQDSLVWYKLLYEEVDHLAGMVVLHSNHQPPEQGKLACKTIAKCESMKDWYEKQGEEDVNGISDILRFAYCCTPDTTEVKEIFHFNLEITGGLELDTHFYHKENQDDATDDTKRPSPSAPPVKTLRFEMDKETQV